jgi:hypothetical protein
VLLRLVNLDEVAVEERTAGYAEDGRGSLINRRGNGAALAGVSHFRLRRC